LNAEETLDFYGRLFNIPSAVRKQRVAQLIQMVGLESAKKRQLREYSKGMTRRIGLAQALINDPDLILLDEPTSGLDPIGTRNMKNLILQLKEQGKTVIMSSHLLGDVQDVCDRVGVLYQGELKELGRVEDLLKIVEQTEIRVDGLSDEAKRKIEAIVAEDKANLLFCGNPTTSLEDLFHDIIAESEAHPGKRVRGGEKA
jgi:ABC-2 type transport system ATP-binding protein